MQTTAEPTERPILVLALYIAHWFLLVIAVCYALAAWGYVRLSDDVAVVAVLIVVALRSWSPEDSP